MSGRANENQPPQMGSPASAHWVEATYLQSLGNTEESRLMWPFKKKKKKKRWFHFVCHFVFNTPHMHHNSWVRRFFLSRGKFRYSSLFPFLIWLMQNLSVPFPTESLQRASEKDFILTTLAITANGSGWSFFLAVCAGTRHHHLIKYQLAGSSP